MAITLTSLSWEQMARETRAVFSEAYADAYTMWIYHNGVGHYSGIKSAKLPLSRPKSRRTSDVGPTRRERRIRESQMSVPSGRNSVLNGFLAVILEWRFFVIRDIEVYGHIRRWVKRSGESEQEIYFGIFYHVVRHPKLEEKPMPP